MGLGRGQSPPPHSALPSFLSHVAHFELGALGRAYESCGMLLEGVSAKKMGLGKEVDGEGDGDGDGDAVVGVSEGGCRKGRICDKFCLFV